MSGLLVNNQNTITNKYRNFISFYQRVSLILPAMVLLLLLTGYPMIQIIRLSFSESTAKLVLSGFGFQNYIKVLGDPLFWNSVKNTLIFCLTSVFAGLVIGLSLALLLNQRINGRFRAFFRSMFMFPWLISSTVIAATWLLIFNPFGLLNGVLDFLGFEALARMAWLGDERTALFGIIVSNIWRGSPFMMLMLLAGLQTIPEYLYEAAELDGAGPFQKLFYITIPHIKNIIFTVTTLELIWNFRAFDLVFLMTGGGPMNSSEILSTYVYNYAFRRMNFGFAAAAAIVMLLIMVLMSIPYLKDSVGKLKD